MRPFGYPIHARSVVVGAALALAISIPVAALVTATLEADSWLNVAAVLLAGLGYAMGGYWAGWRQPRTPAVHGAAAATVAVAVLVGIRIVRRLAGGDDMVWGSIVVSILLAVWLGAAGGVLGSRRALAGRGPGGGSLRSEPR